MNKTIAGVIDKLVSKTLKVNINSTTSVCAFQPKLPAEIKKQSKK